MREKGVINIISNLSNRQQRIRRKQWKKDSRNYRKRKSLQQAKETPEAEETRVGSRGSPRIQSGRKEAKRTYSSLRYKLQSMIAKSLKQARKIESLRRENYCLKFKDKSKCPLSPATKVRKLIGRKKLSPEIRRNLLLNFAFMSGLEENKVFKKKKKKEAGHGKGAMDGVGGALKRMADTLVARGTDITDSDSFLQNLKKTETVKLYKIENTDIANLKEKSRYPSDS
ncbi:hypothetical protein AVEN_103989-1 [Araneus ventricosus]|uniref:Uncharacterized protein n=1 Tax=Araneus ventricosus TaxID=182803 RepID=A0A4Y2PKE2_ARAVE|nr:hypothetical protein AVEN_66381-1 [Araneus ventricosus]GBN82428.1 hypothetical protein AVEN_103989-1 [Araneus ventricosus]